MKKGELRCHLRGIRRGGTSLVWVLLLGSIGCETTQPENPEGILRIYLARHGQTEWNAQRRLQGGSDTELNETGHTHARALAERLADVPLDAIYCSELRRSRDTAAYLADRAPVQSLAELNEQSLGRFEGVYVDGRDPALEEEFWRRLADPTDDLDGGESGEQHFARVEMALKSILERHPTGNILIVGHGGTNTQILRSLLRLTAEKAAEIHQANDELYLIELVEGSLPQVWKNIPPDRLMEL